MNEKQVNWSVYSCSQNLPAILNDPNRGKQRDFFTKTWGEAFVESQVIPPSSRLEDVPNVYFVPYVRKLLKRYRKLQEKKSTSSLPAREDSLHNLFPHLAIRETSQLLKPETSPIPKIYFTPTFNLANTETFREVFGVDGTALPSKLIQDRLSHYLDLVEVGLAQQISKKSSAFFSAVSTQDKVAERVSKALISIQQIKDDIKAVKEDSVVAPFTIVKMTKRNYNMCKVHQKLQLMATVHQAQRAIQSLLGNSDYVGALDLITTTQDVLRQELQGLVSFRHLDSQLVEIRNVIEKMLRNELERNLSANLNRPIEQMVTFIDKDRLVSIVLGHLRLGKNAPILSILSKEISTSMTTTCKQTLIEAVSESDSKSDSLIGSNSVQLTIPQLPTELWVKMISQMGERLVQLLQHIKEVIILFQNCADSAVGQLPGTSIDILPGVPESEEPLISVQIFSTFSSELVNQLDKTTAVADEKFTGMLRYRKTWHNRVEFFATLHAVRDFIAQLEGFANSLAEKSLSSTNSEDATPTSKTYRFTSAAEMKSQTTDFFKDFHQKKTEVVNLSLDREKWRVKQERHIPSIRDIFAGKSCTSNGDCDNSNNALHVNSNHQGEATNNASINHTQDSLINSTTNGENSSSSSSSDNGSEIVRTAEVFFVILQVISEYCHLVNVTFNAEVILGVVDLLRGANARIAHLVLGAGAVELKVCKSITVANLAVVVRGLCLVASGVPIIKEIFQKTLPNKNHHLLKHLDTVHLEITRHSEDVENKMISIVEDIIDAELINWEARPPVPSVPISSVSKNIVKFREAIGSVLTDKQISSLFMRVDKTFRTKLKEKISILGIRKDGGPRHGVVTSEMMHYAENLRKLNVLPPSVISNSGLTNELWA